MTLFTLKIIALVSMTLDHAFKTLPLYDIIVCAVTNAVIYRAITFVVLSAGRVAFPIFAFTVANGCKKTSDRRGYLTRLMIFGIVSEPIYYILHNGGLNVFITLAAAASAVYIAGRFKRIWIRLLIYSGFALLAELCGCDYGMFGVAAVALFYELPSLPVAAGMVSLTLMLNYLRSFMAGSLSAASLLFIALGYAFTALLIPLYNGNRGPHLKWLFYVYYPAHLTVLYLLGILL